jgi:hypothetical protein
MTKKVDNDVDNGVNIYLGDSEYGDSRDVEIVSGDGQWMSRKWQLVMLVGGECDVVASTNQRKGRVLKPQTSGRETKVETSRQPSKRGLLFKQTSFSHQMQSSF